MNELPEELSVNPVPFIAFIGLDAPNNPDHLTVWNSFAINRSFDRPVLYYKLIEQNRKFPPSKIRVESLKKIKVLNFLNYSYHLIS